MNTTVQFAAPRNRTTEGHLVVRRGLGEATIAVDAAVEDLYSAHCSHGVQATQAGRRPRADVHDGTVVLTYPRLSGFVRSDSDVISLNALIPWRIEVEGGMGEVSADLTGVTVTSFVVDGGVNRSDFHLPAPTGTLPMRFGAVSHVSIRRPDGIPVRIHVRRGSRRVIVDGQSIGAVSGPTTFTTPGYIRAVDRVDITVDAADGLTITT